MQFLVCHFVQRTTFKVLPSRKQVCPLSLFNRLAVARGKPAMIVSKTRQLGSVHSKQFFTNQTLRWLNRVMQDHEARVSDLNRKLIFSFFLLFSSSKLLKHNKQGPKFIVQQSPFSVKLKLLKHRHFLTSVWL